MMDKLLCYKVTCDGQIWAVTDNKMFADELADNISNVLHFSITPISFDEALHIAQTNELVIRRFYSFIKVGTKVYWNDVAINDFDEEEREEQLKRIYTIDKIINDEMVLISDEYSEVEVPINELTIIKSHS